MFKKLLSTILTLCLLAVLSACTAKMVTLPDLSGKSEAEVTSILEDLSLVPVIYYDNSVIYTDDSQYDKFVRYGSELTAGSEVEKNSEVKLYMTPLNLSVHYIYELMNTDLELQTSDFEGKNFIADGIGEVTVAKYVDGDTTLFSAGGTSFSVRYLGIDTPESTALFEPWGKAASTYTQSRLSTAQKIVLQSEGDRMDGNGRYLAWVWYLPAGEDQFVLLNLELVELAYSKNKVSSGSAYTEILSQADLDASRTRRRVWGEIDPHYDYSKEGTQMTIKYLQENFDTYYGLKVSIEGVVTRKVGNTFYIQDENGYGIYIYSMLSFAQIQVGEHLSISALTPTYYNGNPQLTNLKEKYIVALTDEMEITATEISYDEFDVTKIGSLVSMDHLLIKSIYTSSTMIVSLTVEDASGNEFEVRIDTVSTNISFEAYGISVGDYISVTAPLGYYDYDYDSTATNYVYVKAYFQLTVCSSADIVKE